MLYYTYHHGQYWPHCFCPATLTFVVVLATLISTTINHKRNPLEKSVSLATNTSPPLPYHADTPSLWWSRQPTLTPHPISHDGVCRLLILYIVMTYMLYSSSSSLQWSTYCPPCHPLHNGVHSLILILILTMNCTAYSWSSSPQWGTRHTPYSRPCVLE